MLPSVVNAIKNPSRACKKREKVGTMIWCYRVLDSTEWIKKNSTLTLSHIIIICGSWMHYQMILTCVIDVLLFTIYGASICLKVITFSTPVKIQFSWKLNSHHVILPSSPWAFLKCFLFFLVLYKYILLGFTSSISWVNSSLLRNDGFQSCLTSQVSFCAVMSETDKEEDSVYYMTETQSFLRRSVLVHNVCVTFSYLSVSAGSQWFSAKWWTCPSCVDGLDPAAWCIAPWWAH